ncbi:MAG: hypothetical protein WAW37_11140 [Syntrophobacteraceae bacterium]
MQFILGLFVGTFLGITILGLCRCLAFAADESLEEDDTGVEHNLRKVAAKY